MPYISYIHGFHNLKIVNNIFFFTFNGGLTFLSKGVLLPSKRVVVSVETIVISLTFVEMQFYLRVTAALKVHEPVPQSWPMTL